MIRVNRLLPLIIGLSVLAAACGGGGVSSPQTPSGRGQLIKSPPAKLGSFSVSDLLSSLSGSAMGQELLKLAALAPTCPVDTYPPRI